MIGEVKIFFLLNLGVLFDPVVLETFFYQILISNILVVIRFLPMASIRRGCERSCWLQRPYCLSENFENPVVNKRPVSPR